MAGSTSDIFIYLKSSKYKSLQPIKVLIIPGQTINIEEEETKALNEKKAAAAAAKAAAAAAPKRKAKGKAKPTAEAAATACDDMSAREKIVTVMKKMRTKGFGTTKRSMPMIRPSNRKGPTNTTSKSREMENSNC